jgi:hypothetical protein
MTNFLIYHSVKSIILPGKDPFDYMGNVLVSIRDARIDKEKSCWSHLGFGIEKVV